MRTYISYVNNYPSAIDLVRKLHNENPKFTAFIDSVSNHPRCNTLNFASLLIMPVQRIPVFIWFLL